MRPIRKGEMPPGIVHRFECRNCHTVFEAGQGEFFHREGKIYKHLDIICKY